MVMQTCNCNLQWCSLIFSCYISSSDISFWIYFRIIRKSSSHKRFYTVYMHSSWKRDRDVIFLVERVKVVRIDENIRYSVWNNSCCSRHWILLDTSQSEDGICIRKILHLKKRLWVVSVEEYSSLER